MDCDALKSIHIPALVEEIDAYAFSDCDELKSVYFEEIPKTLHRKAFADCDKLHEISVPSEGVKAIRKALHVVDGDVDFLVVGREDPNKPAIDGHKKDSKKENDSEPSKVNKPTDKQKDSKAKNSPKPKDTGKITKEKESGNK